MSLSSPIMISSMSLQLPSFTASGLSKVEAISPPADDLQRCHKESTFQMRPPAWMLSQVYHPTAGSSHSKQCLLCQSSSCRRSAHNKRCWKTFTILRQ